jgi:hypothetical protein
MTSSVERLARDATDPHETWLCVLAKPHYNERHGVNVAEVVRLAGWTTTEQCTRGEHVMALEMWFWIVDETTVQKLRQAPHLLAEFLDNNEPVVPGPIHRNVDMFHFILNGTDDHVGGIRDIFNDLDDVWTTTIRGKAVEEEEDIEDTAIAITSETTRQLLKAFRKLDEKIIRKRWSQLIRRRGLVEDENEPGLTEAERTRRKRRRGEEENDPYFRQSFANLTQLCEQAVRENKTLMWRWDNAP